LELVYLWVEDYKNIHKQGFNFSSRFKCEFDGENLTINENKDYMSIFPENINVTAIVGENGSGKSSLLEYFYKLDEYIPHNDEYYNDTCEKIENFIYVFNDEIGCKFISNIENIKSNKIKVQQVKHRYLIGFFHNHSEENRESQITSINVNKKIIIELILTIYTEYESYPSHYIKDDSNFELTTFFYLPNKIEIIPKDIKEVYRWSMNMAQVHNHDIAVEIENNKEDMFDSINDDYHLFLIMWYIENIGFDKKILMDKNSLTQQYNSNDSTKEKDKLSEQEFTNYYSNKFLIFKNLTNQEKKIYFDMYKDYFEFDFIDNQNRRYNNLSHGEQNLYGQFLNIFYHLVLEYSYEKIRDELFFILDEPDIALHPNWQKKYIQELINLCSKFNKKIHFIITSHSPFIISDLPKENVIFLDKINEKTSEKYPLLDITNLQNGNCINVSKFIDINPFGANIHTLLSHGFFMEGGLMGEFTKNKITEIIEILKKEQLSEDEIKSCKHIISIIGEPILQKTLEHQLSEKLNPNETELQKLEREQKEIQAKIDKLTGKNNEKD
jgi:predicted ATPase